MDINYEETNSKGKVVKVFVRDITEKEMPEWMDIEEKASFINLDRKREKKRAAKIARAEKKLSELRAV